MTYAFAINLEGNTVTGFKQLEADAVSFKNKVNQVSKDINQNLGSSFDNLGMSLSKLVKGFIALEGVRSFLKIGTEMEQTNLSFEVMLGNAEKAKTMISELQQFAIVTPFTTKDIAEAAKMLLNYGVAEDKILSDIKLLGDASGGTKEKFDRMTYAYAQIMATGRLMGQDLRQLVDAGFNPLQEISRKTGKSMMDLKKDMESGNISAEMVRNAFISVTSEGGRFYKMMERQSKTVGGLWSTFIDTVQLRAIKLFNQFAPIFKKLIISFTELANIVSPILGVIGELLLKIVGILEKMWPVLKIIVELFIAWGALKVFDYLVTGVVSFFNYLVKLPTLIAEIGAGLNSWTLGLAGSLVSIVMIDQIIKQIKSGGKYGEELAGPYRKEMGDIEKQSFEMEKKGMSSQDSATYKSLWTRHKELSDVIDDLSGNNGYLTRFFTITTEQVKGMFKGMADKLGIMPKPSTGTTGTTGGMGAATQNAFNTSALSGAAGGLGEAKIIKIDFHAPLMKVDMPGGNGMDVVAKAPMTIEMMLRLINNLSQSQGSTM